MPDFAPAAAFRVTYERAGELRDDLAQMARGGLLVRAPDVSGLDLDSPVSLELVLPNGESLEATAKVLHVFPGVGVAVSVNAEILDQLRRNANGRDAGAGPARHERLDRPMNPASEPIPSAPRTRGSTGEKARDSLTHAEKIQVALHGNRDQRNAILRDSNRVLHPFVLKNPRIDSEDVLAIAKNAQMTPELLKMIADRKEWFHRPQIALALARNPKTPPEVAVRALDHVPIEALRQIAKGSGALPHVAQAARKKVTR